MKYEGCIPNSTPILLQEPASDSKQCTQRKNIISLHNWPQPVINWVYNPLEVGLQPELPMYKAIYNDFT